MLTVWVFGSTIDAFEEAIAIVTDPSPNVTSRSRDLTIYAVWMSKSKSGGFALEFRP